MILRGINFGPILDASGVQGFFGEEYRHQKYMGPLKPDLTGSGFVAKTTTFEPRLKPEEKRGNMPMKADGMTPAELLPRCIMPNFHPGKIAMSARMFLKGIMLNSVSLSGPGAPALLETGMWQEREKPFMISFMSVSSTPEGKMLDTKRFINELFKHISEFRAKFGIQFNETCPNVGLNTDCHVDEIRKRLLLASGLDIPIGVKVNVLTPIKAALEISRDPNCDFLCVSNTIHWDLIPEVGIDRKKLLGTDISPLAEFGGGGLSGAPLLNLVIRWLYEARRAGITKPINAGGGILHPNDLYRLKPAGASSVFIGSVATLRPWRVKKIIRKAYELFGNGG